MHVASPLPYGSSIDLTNCEREPIHTPGHVQSHGVLFVVEPQSHRVLQVSDNAELHFECNSASLLGQSLADLLSPAAAAATLAHLQREVSDNLSPFPEICFRGPFIGPKAVIVSAHRSNALWILEAEPATADDDAGAPQLLRALVNAQRQLDGAAGLRTFCQRLTEQFSRITGYDRVMVYRFAPDWHGWVFAETMVDGLHPFLDLHYPASDIPAQARRLFLENGARLLVDARSKAAPLSPELLPDHPPLDMSYASLRGASQMYTEYLRNMGVRGTFTLALPQRGRLWGMIACHHYEAPRYLSPELRSACTMLAQFAGARIGELADAEVELERHELNRKRTALVRALAHTDDLVAGLREAIPTLADLVPSESFCAYMEHNLHGHGQTPAPEVTQEILSILKGQPRGEVFATDCLSAYSPALAEQADCAAGILAVPIDHQDGAWLIWYRGEQTRSVNWAGDPHKPVEIGPMGSRLTPRKSFELWCETVKGHSEPFTEAELDAAGQLRTALSDVLFRERSRLQALARELVSRNQELDSFNMMASHDLREPLRAIANYATFIEEDAGAQLDGDSQTHLRHIKRLVQRMYALIEGLLNFSRFGHRQLVIERIDLNELVRKIQLDFDSTTTRCGATISVVNQLPTLASWGLALEEILSNLIGNSLKYSDEAPHILIGSVTDAEERERLAGPSFQHLLYIRDHGIGIPREHVETVFKIFQRLHRSDRYGGGTGTGLPIVRRLVERLHGRIWIEAAAPGTVFYLALNDFPKDRGQCQP